MISVSNGWAGMHGTGFLAKLEGHLLFMTARHCLGTLQNDLGRVAAALMVTADFPASGKRLSRDTCLSFTHLGLAKARENLESHLGKDGDMDLACLLVGNKGGELYRRAFARATDIVDTPDLMSFLATSGKDLKVLVHGFPACIPDTGIDDEGVKLGHTRLLGTYAGLGSYPHTHKLKITDRDGIDNLDGMSGSPIYVKAPPPPGRPRNHYILIGMAVNGAGETIEFIGQKQLVTAASDLIRNYRSVD